MSGNNGLTVWNGNGIELQSLDSVAQFANIVLHSNMAPKSLSSVDKIIVALQCGSEVGMSPMQSLQSVAVINGKPSLYGDAIPALVHASGKCEFIREETVGQPGQDDFGYEITSKRKDQSEPLTTRFTIAMAKHAGVWGKQGPWKDYPARMLKIRARAWNLRDNFADVLNGMGVKEEIEDYSAPRTRDIQPARLAQPQEDPLQADEWPEIPEGEVIEPTPQNGMSDEEKQAIIDAEQSQ